MIDIAIPHGAWWSSPFCRWQGSLAHLHSLEFAAWLARRELAARRLDPAVFDHGVLGISVPQRASFYGLPWVMGMIGAPQAAGPTISQACATGARVLQSAAAEIRDGAATTVLAITADRTSNGPHLYYPAPDRPGGTGQHENWVLDNFDRDPYANLAMVDTAENVARKYGLDTARQHDLVLQRYAQYRAALADDAAFLRRFMTLPFEVPDSGFRKTVATLAGDEGIVDTSAEKLAKLKPVRPEGTVTFGGQTHPADGSAAMVLTTPARARELARDPGIEVRLLGFGQARVERGYMPEAPVPAARRALAAAGVEPRDLAVVTTHNPFIVNDLVLGDALGLDQARINPFGCSLVWGHPQGPTGMRSVIELIEALILRGGGTGLFTGCAAGDTGMAAVVRVGDA